MIVMYEIKLLPLHPSIVTAIVLWCNGSTSDSGSACEGSNPSKTTKIYHSRYLTGYFRFSLYEYATKGKCDDDHLQSRTVYR